MVKSRFDVLLLIVSVIVLLTPLERNAVAQTAAVGDQQVPSTIIEGFGVEPLAEVPFELAGQHVVMKVELEGKSDAESETLQFVFDTGATATVLDSGTAEALGLNPDRQQTATGTGGSSSYSVCSNQTLRFSDEVKASRIPLVLVDLNTLSEGIGAKLDGITGNDFLSRYLIQIDHSQNRIRFFKRNSKLDLAGYKEVPFRFKNGIPIPVIECEIELDSGDRVRGDVLVDTGAGLTVSLNRPFHLENKVLEKSGSHYVRVGNGLTSSNESKVIRARSVSLAEFGFGEMEIQLASATSGVSNMPGFLGILGNEILKRFDIIVDYRSKKMFVKQSDLFDVDFRFNNSGLSLYQRNDRVYVHSTISGTQADQEGVCVGWELLAIEGEPFQDLLDARKRMRVDQKTLTLTFQTDDGEKREIELALKRLLDQ